MSRFDSIRNSGKTTACSCRNSFHSARTNFSIPGKDNEVVRGGRLDGFKELTHGFEFAGFFFFEFPSDILKLSYRFLRIQTFTTVQTDFRLNRYDRAVGASLQ